MATAHIMSNKEDIASIVIMPGDPKRAKFIADEFLTNVKEVNNVRNMLAYTGYYNNKKITVFPSGMGIPSMGIYAHELFSFYDVDTIIRIGTCGSYKEELDLFDLILVDKSYSDSNFAKSYSGVDTNVTMGNSELNKKIENTAQQLNKKLYVGNVFCSECFYSLKNENSKLIAEHDCLAVEMESFALFHIAEKLKKKASVVLTVSDSFISKKETTALEREKGLKDMIHLVLESIS